jgi:uncharacterized membrane protein
LKRFHTDVAKVDRDVAYVAMVVQVCCKHLSPMFHLFFQMYVASAFILMFKVFYLDIVYVCNSFSIIFASILDACFKYFMCLFFMLQVLHLDISKVVRLLHMGCAWEAEGGVTA